MTLEELEGSYESAKTLGPGTRYLLTLDGPRAGLRVFTLMTAAWTLTGRNVPGSDRPDVQLIGRRQLEGAYRLDDLGLVLQVRHITDTVADGRGLGHPPPIRRAVSEIVGVELVASPRLELHFKLYGSAVVLAKV